MNLNIKFGTRLFNLVTLLSLLVLVGCGGKPATVSGTISVDGNALDQGTVTFTPVAGGMRASAIIQGDGSYEVMTNRDVGLDVGEYAVAVVSREVIIGKGGPPMPGKYLAPKRYGKTKTSGLQYSIEKGTNVIDIDLSSEDSKADRPTRNKRS